MDVERIVKLQSELVCQWHDDDGARDSNHIEGYLRLVRQQHQWNFRLWHLEDQARDPNARPEAVAKVKRSIDEMNQSRNDAIERIDDWLVEELVRRKIVAASDARLNTETPGSAVDRLSILALRIFHLDQKVDSLEIDADFRKTVEGKLAICHQQRLDLTQSLRELLEEMRYGRFRHRTYRQLKMYNDPRLNPYLRTTQQN